MLLNRTSLSGLDPDFLSEAPVDVGPSRRFWTVDVAFDPKSICRKCSSTAYDLLDVDTFTGDDL